MAWTRLQDSFCVKVPPFFVPTLPKFSLWHGRWGECLLIFTRKRPGLSPKGSKMAQTSGVCYLKFIQGGWNQKDSPKAGLMVIHHGRIHKKSKKNPSYTTSWGAKSGDSPSLHLWANPLLDVSDALEFSRRWRVPPKQASKHTDGRLGTWHGGGALQYSLESSRRVFKGVPCSYIFHFQDWLEKEEIQISNSFFRWKTMENLCTMSPYDMGAQNAGWKYTLWT